MSVHFKVHTPGFKSKKKTTRSYQAKKSSPQQLLKVTRVFLKTVILHVYVSHMAFS